MSSNEKRWFVLPGARVYHRKFFYAPESKTYWHAMCGKAGKYPYNDGPARWVKEPPDESRICAKCVKAMENVLEARQLDLEIWASDLLIAKTRNYSGGSGGN